MASIRKVVKTIPITVVSYTLGTEKKTFESTDSETKAIGIVKKLVPGAKDIKAVQIDRTYEMLPETFLAYATPINDEENN